MSINYVLFTDEISILNCIHRFIYELSLIVQKQLLNGNSLLDFTCTVFVAFAQPDQGPVLALIDFAVPGHPSARLQAPTDVEAA